MKDIRIGNDINVRWSIFSEDEPFILEGRDISVYLRTPFGKGKIEQFTIQGNVVEWTFPGKQQKCLGKHSLTLVINEGADGMITTDACDFVNLVKCSCQAHGADDSGVQTEVVALASNLDYVAGGGGSGEAYDDTYLRTEVARLEREKATKTEVAEQGAKLDELSAEIGKKQDTITDLETIRSGAAKGATALQSVPDTYATKQYVENLLGTIINGDY